MNFNMELYGRGGADEDNDYGDTTVLIEFEQPRDWKYRDRTKDGVAGVGGAAGGPMVAHTTAWNRWDTSYPRVPPDHGNPVTLGLLIDFDEGLIRMGLWLGQRALRRWIRFAPSLGPTLPFARDAPLRLGLSGFYGERKVKEVLGDGSIKAKRIAVTLQTDRTVPPSMLSCRHVDCGTCDYLTCRACLFENSADGQAERDEAEEAAAAAADDP